jgi:prepilin-type N-terminal cleavage/methylation domain-containing protein
MFDYGKYCERNRRAPARRHSPALTKPFGAAERPFGLRPFRSTSGGFSLLELMVSMVILSLIMGGFISALSTSEQTYARTELGSDMYENVRSVAELLAQEIGQAGLVSLPTTTLTAAVTISATTATVSQTASMYVGEQLLVDAGSANEELVTLNAVTSTTFTTTTATAFTHVHAIGAPVTVLGAYPSGIVPVGATDGSTSVNEPGKSILNMYGDINGDGTLVYIRYTCDTTATPGTLTRSVTTITPGVNTISTAQTLLSTLIPNPSPTGAPNNGSNGTPCFQYTSYPVTVAGTVYTFVTNVGLTISVRSLTPDPQTQAYLTMTKSFLDLSPRNVLAGFELGNLGLANRIQAQPPNVSVY